MDFKTPKIGYSMFEILKKLVEFLFTVGHIVFLYLRWDANETNTTENAQNQANQELEASAEAFSAHNALDINNNSREELQTVDQVEEAVDQEEEEEVDVDVKFQESAEEKVLVEKTVSVEGTEPVELKEMIHQDEPLKEITSPKEENSTKENKPPRDKDSHTDKVKPPLTPSGKNFELRPHDNAGSSENTPITKTYKIKDGLVGRIVGKGGVRIKQMEKDLKVNLSVSRTCCINSSDGIKYKDMEINGPRMNVEKTIRALDQILGKDNGEQPHESLSHESLSRKSVTPKKKRRSRPDTPHPMKTPSKSDTGSRSVKFTAAFERRKEPLNVQDEKVDNNFPLTPLGDWIDAQMLLRDSKIRPPRTAEIAADENINSDNDMTPKTSRKTSSVEEGIGPATMEGYKSLLKIMMEECLLSESHDTFITEFKQKFIPSHRKIALKILLTTGLAKPEEWRDTVIDLIMTMLKANNSSLLAPRDVKEAVRAYLYQYSYLRVDYPKTAQYTAQYFNKLLYFNYLTFGDIFQCSTELIKDGHGGEYLAAQLNLLKKIYGDDDALDVWNSGGLTVKHFLSKMDHASDFIRSNGLEFFIFGV